MLTGPNGKSGDRVPIQSGQGARKLVAIAGPTGVGKTELAISLASTLNAEIVNADSRQVYRYMDIGTAKPTPEQQAQAPHHLLDIVNPDEDFNLALYLELVNQSIADIQQRGKLPLLVGGSGLYVWAVVDGWRIPRLEPDRELRQKLETRAKEEGPGLLHAELKRLDPIAAERIDPRNIRRVIRALEVCYKTERPFSEQYQKAPPPYPVLIIGLTLDREELYRRVDNRMDSMVEKGLVAEVQGLMARGYGLDLPAMSGVGYKEIGQYLQGGWDLAIAIQKAKFATHRFIRHQYAWFHLSDERISWLQAGEGMGEKAKALVASFMIN